MINMLFLLVACNQEATLKDSTIEIVDSASADVDSLTYAERKIFYQKNCLKYRESFNISQKALPCEQDFKISHTKNEFINGNFDILFKHYTSKNETSIDVSFLNKHASMSSIEFTAYNNESFDNILAIDIVNIENISMHTWNYKDNNWNLQPSFVCQDSFLRKDNNLTVTINCSLYTSEQSKYFTSFVFEEEVLQFSVYVYYIKNNINEDSSSFLYREKVEFNIPTALLRFAMHQSYDDIK